MEPTYSSTSFMDFGFCQSYVSAVAAAASATIIIVIISIIILIIVIIFVCCSLGRFRFSSVLFGGPKILRIPDHRRVDLDFGRRRIAKKHQRKREDDNVSVEGRALMEENPLQPL